MEVKIKEDMKYIEESNFCVCCGVEIPEGTMICNECKKKV